jgi:hypothetical protein
MAKKYDEKDVVNKDDASKTSNSKTNSSFRSSNKSKSSAKRSNRDNPVVSDGPRPLPNRDAGLNHGWSDVIRANVNDISWYSRSPELLMDAASISWFAPTGQRTHIMKGAATPGEDLSTTMPTVPGIMTFSTAMIPGYSADNTSAVNVAARDIYSDVRSTNSGGKNYDPANLMMYFIALDSAYGIIAWLRRVHKELCVTSMYNRYLPEVNVRSEGFDYDDLVGHISDLRWFINAMQVKLGGLAIPASLPIFLRHMYLMSNLFADSPNQKSQIYKFVPDGYWFYDDTTVPAKLVWTKFPDVPLTFDLIKTIVLNMINALCQSEDIGVMSGDVIRYYGEGVLFRMEPLLPEEVIVPIYNEEMLDQIQNMNIINADLFSYDKKGDVVPFYITEDPSYTGPSSGALLCRPVFNYTLNRQLPYAWETARVFNIENADPNPAQTMILSRLALSAIPAFTAEEHPRLVNCCGTEIITHAKVWYLNDVGGTLTPTQIEAYGTYAYASYDAVSLARLIMFNAFYRMFDRHPAVYTLTGTADPDWNVLGDSNIELSNYTLCDVSTLQKMHDAAVLSEFGVPVIGSRANNLK